VRALVNMCVSSFGHTKARNEGFVGSIQDESLLSVRGAFNMNLKASSGQSQAADVLYSRIWGSFHNKPPSYHGWDEMRPGHVTGCQAVPSSASQVNH